MTPVYIADVEPITFLKQNTILNGLAQALKFYLLSSGANRSIIYFYASPL
jgi:hypothetical protein